MANLTQAQALAAYRRVCRYFDWTAPAVVPVVRQGQDSRVWAAGPVLCRDFEDRGGWAIVWEDGGDWAMRAGAAADSGTVWSEPFYSFALSLYSR